MDFFERDGSVAHRALAWALLATLFLSGGCGSATADQAPSEPVIYVIRRGWHIDLGFAVEDLDASLKTVGGPLVGAKFLVFGFGDEHYLTARRHDGSVLLSALWPGKGIVLLTGLTKPPLAAFGGSQVRRLPLTAAQEWAAQEFIWQSLESATSMAPGPYAGSLYFSARPRYSALHTCNTWVAEVLQHAGLPVRSTGVIFSGQLWSQIARLATPDP